MTKYTTTLLDHQQSSQATLQNGHWHLHRNQMTPKLRHFRLPWWQQTQLHWHRAVPHPGDCHEQNGCHHQRLGHLAILMESRERERENKDIHIFNSSIHLFSIGIYAYIYIYIYIYTYTVLYIYISIYLYLFIFRSTYLPYICLM